MRITQAARTDEHSEQMTPKSIHTIVSMLSILARPSCIAIRQQYRHRPTAMALHSHLIHPPHRNTMCRNYFSTIRSRRKHHRSRTPSSQITSHPKDSAFTQYTIDETTCPPTDIAILRNTVCRHVDSLDKYLSSKPIASYNVEAFEEALNFVEAFYCRLFTNHSSGGSNDNSGSGQEYSREEYGAEKKVKVILDSGCGTGKSSKMLSELYSDCVVIGIDRSLVRLNKNKEYRTKLDNQSNHAPSCTTRNNTNLLLLRADLIDFWHLCLTSTKWQRMVHVQKHYILYPNPYPKKSRLKNRFYAHPSFPLLMCTVMPTSSTKRCSDGLVIRSNWRGYLEEFGMAVQVWEEAGLSLGGVYNLVRDGAVEFEKLYERDDGRLNWDIIGPRRIEDTDSNAPMTNFEAKYFECGEPVYELKVKPVMKSNII